MHTTICGFATHGPIRAHYAAVATACMHGDTACSTCLCSHSALTGTRPVLELVMPGRNPSGWQGGPCDKLTSRIEGTRELCLSVYGHLCRGLLP